ncbi:MAG: nucleotide-binding protein [Candidatus Rokuibacteriota bacterium]
MPSRQSPKPRSETVFVVHGRSLRARDAMFEFLEALDLRPMHWSEAVRTTGRGLVHISTILASALAKAQAVVVLFTGDDEGRLRKRFRREGDPPHETETTPQPRLNVVFEAGIAFGRYPRRTIFVQLGRKMRPFSDISGFYIDRFKGTRRQRELLRAQLARAGCTIRARKDWLEAGDFSRPVRDE